MKDTYDAEKMKAFSLGVSEEALRLKGFFMTAKGDIAHVDCVGDYISIAVVENEKEEIRNNYKIVLIGKKNVEYDEKISEMWNIYFPEKELQCVKS